jgi:predicted dehydrogenase/threonine dehydrogenase-like Zn-dependent dehydrogenase
LQHAATNVKIVLQNPADGEVAVTEVPAPKLLPGCVLVKIAASLVSAGTERASAEFASKNLAQKAKARPDLVREVVNKVRRDGLLSTVATVRSRLDQPAALGYSSAGSVISVAEGVNDIKVGDRVACAGAGYAVHAEFACIPRLLLAEIPAKSSVSFEEAAFTTVGAVALHGMRVAEVKLGETVAVIGLGLLGQLTVQMLKAAGCRVLGMDIDPSRTQLASELGAEGVSSSAEEFADICKQWSNGRGVDSVLITAETSSSGPVNLAGVIARDRGVVTAVGTVGIDIQRKQYYEKELDFRISRSYGPGRYDTAFEQKGRDYPIGYVRWTETRNMEAFLQLLADEKLNVKALITHRFPVDQARGAYDLITGKAGEPSLGVLILYAGSADESQHIEFETDRRAARAGTVNIGWLGAGAFATDILIPAAKRVSGIGLVGVCTANGTHSRQAAEKFGFRYCTTDEHKIILDPDVNAVVISTRHHLHGAQVLAAMRSGKHVFCEKPLCLTEPELAEIVHAATNTESLLTVGFNRRFAPMARRMKEFLRGIQEPLSLHYRVNAGFITADHWVNDPEQGGGRILGEVCHFIDFLIFLAESQPVEVHTRSLSDTGQYSGENVVIAIQFFNGSQGTITYLANGDRSFSKERIEVFGGGAVAVLEDFRCLELVRHGRKQTMHSRLRQDKGHRAEWEAFAAAIKAGSESPIAMDDIVATTLTTFGALESKSTGQPIAIEIARFIQSNS